MTISRNSLRNLYRLSRNHAKESLVQNRGGGILYRENPLQPSSKSFQRQAVVTSYPLAKITLAAAVSAIVFYDGAVNDFTYSGAAFRFLRSMKTAGLIMFDYIVVMRNPDADDYDARMKATHHKSAHRLLNTCLHNGGLYIKVGQGFAAINHILPKEYTDTLALLQDECLPTTKADVQKVFIDEFGKLPEEIFDEFDYKPVAAASLAQVFKAKMRNGEDVAVKVQYSDLQKRFTSDLGTIIFLQDIIELIFKDYNFGWIMRDLRINLEQEMDFVHEAKNSEKCAEDLKKFEYVYIPKVHWEHTKTRVLTLEWIDGIKISDLDCIKSNKMNIKDIDVKLFETFSEQIFNTGFIHADPHPGNIFVRKHPKSGKAQLVLIDHGLYESLPENVRVPLCEFWEATVLRDEKKMKEAAKKININDHMKFAEVLFQQPIRFGGVGGGGIRTKLSQEQIDYMQEVARKNFDKIMSTLKEMPRNMLFVVRNLNTIRAIGHQHGDVVDRPRVMARHAQRSLYNRLRTFKGYVHWIYQRALFEYCLWRQSLSIYWINFYFNLLYKLGRAPEGAKTLWKDLTTPDLN